MSLTLNDAVKIICDASFDPFFICSTTRILGYNSLLLDVLGYSPKTDLTKKPLNNFLADHFFPKVIVVESIQIPIKIHQITRALLNEKSVNERFSPVRIKSWVYDPSQELYSVSIRDAPILSMYAEKEAFEIGSESIPSLIICNADEFDTSQSLHRLSKNISTGDVTSHREVKNFGGAVFKEFSQLFDHLPCLIWHYGPDGEITYMNKVYREVLGIEHPQENYMSSIHPDDYLILSSLWIKHKKEKTPYEMEIRFQYHPDKPLPPGRLREFRWHILKGVPIPHPQDPSLCRWISSAIDIHDLKTAQKEKLRLEAAEKAAVDASRLKSDFLATMSHEIRTPLFGVVGNACLLMEAGLNAEQKELVESIEISGNLLMTVIQDILDFSRIESGRLSIQNDTFQIDRLLRHLGKILKLESSKKGLEFKISFPNNLGPLHGDSNRILQILTNLASNAIKFTQSGTVHVNVKVVSNTSTEDSSKKAVLKVQVSDTGIGISKESIPKLFTPWSQADITKRRYYGGSGLGLSICKSLVGLMDGDIGLDSNLGQGTVAWFWIPVDTDFSQLNYEQTSIIFSPSPPNSRSPKNPISSDSNQLTERGVGSTSLEMLSDKHLLNSPPFKSDIKRRAKDSHYSSQGPNHIEAKYRVLLAEDNPINQAIISRFLDRMGDVDCLIVGDGQRAYDIYTSRGRGYYDVILLDQGLPSLRGDEICKLIREDDSKQILISISANALLADQVRFLELGMNDSISKPVTFDKFKQVLSYWLNVGLGQRPNSSTGQISL